MLIATDNTASRYGDSRSQYTDALRSASKSYKWPVIARVSIIAGASATLWLAILAAIIR